MQSVNELLRRVEAAAIEQRRLLDLLPLEIDVRGGVVRKRRFETNQKGDYPYHAALSPDEFEAACDVVVEARNGELAELALQLVQAIRDGVKCGSLYRNFG